ncbi:hypothetical protein C8Q74DRAFT_1388179 [Fomes fomentarius]|nr:hypothetical protein C8Q74DRAFT_1388179 [Fomes fomentarius]
MRVYSPKSIVTSTSVAVARRPLMTQWAAAFVLLAPGDPLAQQVFDKKGANHAVPPPWCSTCAACSHFFFAGAIFGPVLTRWIQLLDRLQAHLRVFSRTKAVAYMVFLDQSVFAPRPLHAGGMAMLFGSLTLLKGKSVDDIKGLIPISQHLSVDMAVFIQTQIVNFALVPHHLRFVTIGVVSLFWTSHPLRPPAKCNVLTTLLCAVVRCAHKFL